MSLSGQKAKYSLRADVFRFAPDNRHAVTAPPCRFRADIVAKVRKRAAANFPPKNEASDHRRSTELQTRYQNRL